MNANAFPRRPIAARNAWLARPLAGRGSAIAGIMLHATRSGRVQPDEGERTERWFANPQNIVRDDPPWGSFCDLLILKDGTQVACTAWEDEYAAWGAGYGGSGTWAAGIPYLQVELPQGTPSEPFGEASVASAAAFAAEMSARYRFPLERIAFLEQVGEPPRGIATHEGSANGRRLGKSDPGPLFPWETFLSLAREAASGGSQLDSLLLAVFAGGEERGPSGELLSEAERLRRARYRMTEAAEGRAPSVRELALAARQGGGGAPPKV
jgi:hypothetical protein